MNKNDNLTFKTFAERNMSIAVTFVYFVLAFGFTAFVDYFLLFRDENFNNIVPKLFIAIIISVVVYLLILRRFLSFLDTSETDRKFDLLYSIAIILTCAIFLLFTFLIITLALMLLYVLGALIYGIFSGQFAPITF